MLGKGVEIKIGSYQGWPPGGHFSPEDQCIRPCIAIPEVKVWLAIVVLMDLEHDHIAIG